MSGKYLNYSIAVISLILLSGILYGQEGSDAKPTEAAPKKILTRGMSLSEYRKKYVTNQAPELRKPDLEINGYKMGLYDAVMLKGIREKGFADQYLTQGNDPKAIKYYELASRDLPDEADIYFRLGQIYTKQKVYTLTSKYYKIAMEKYALPSNVDKPKENRLLSQIRYAFYLYKTALLENSDKSRKEAESIERNLEKNLPELKNIYPNAFSEYELLHLLINGQTSIIKQ